MKIIPQGASPHNPSVNTQPTSSQAQARERAIARLSQQAPVPNPGQISPEEIGAIKSQVLQPSGQSNTIVKAEDTPQAPPEPQKEPEVKSPKVDEDPATASQWAALARQEKALRAKAQKQSLELKAREDALVQREAQMAAKAQEYETGYIAKDRFLQNPAQVMAETGLTYDQVTEAFLNQQAVNPQIQAHIAKLEAKLAKIEAANEENSKQQRQAQSDQYQAAVKQIELDVKTLVKAESSYETIRATNSVSDVVDLITQTYNEDGVLLTIEEACEEVENYLVEEAMNLTKIEKIKKRLMPVAQPAAEAQKVQTNPSEAKPTQPMKTLTNANSSTRPLSARERAIQRANGFKGEF